jgi:hypothetical protein
MTQKQWKQRQGIEILFSTTGSGHGTSCSLLEVGVIESTGPALMVECQKLLQIPFLVFGMEKETQVEKENLAEISAEESGDVPLGRVGARSLRTIGTDSSV